MASNEKFADSTSGAAISSDGEKVIGANQDEALKVLYGDSLDWN